MSGPLLGPVARLRARDLLTGALLLGVVAGGAGCTTTLHATTTQPNPLAANPNDATHRSEKLFIDVRDMELPRTFRLRQSAYFAVVSRERLRFHVMLVHKWKEVADPTTWSARLEDDRGRTYYPESREFSYDDHITRMWDYEKRTAVTNAFGDVVRALGEGEINYDVNGNPHVNHNERVPLDSIDVFQGAGDLVFHSKDIFNRGVRRLTLTLDRAGVEYKFTWNLVDLGGDEDTATVPAAELHRSTN